MDSAYAPDLELIRASGNALQKQVLTDLQIDESEVSQMHDAFDSCMAGKGIAVTWTDAEALTIIPVGGMPATDAGMKEWLSVSEEALKACEEATYGNLLYLYTQIYVNPNKQDMLELSAACLVRKGVVQAGYTSADLQRDSSADVKPDWYESTDALACYGDPLHA